MKNKSTSIIPVNADMDCSILIVCINGRESRRAEVSFWISRPFSFKNFKYFSFKFLGKKEDAGSPILSLLWTSFWTPSRVQKLKTVEVVNNFNLIFYLYFNILFIYIEIPNKKFPKISFWIFSENRNVSWKIDFGYLMTVEINSVLTSSCWPWISRGFYDSYSPFCMPAKIIKLVGLKNGGRVSPIDLIIFAGTQNGELLMNTSKAERGEWLIKRKDWRKVTSPKKMYLSHSGKWMQNGYSLSHSSTFTCTAPVKPYKFLAFPEMVQVNVIAWLKE